MFWNVPLLLLIGLCLFCFAAGVQFVNALHCWLRAGALTRLKITSESLKAATLIIAAVGIFIKLYSLLFLK